MTNKHLSSANKKLLQYVTGKSEVANVDLLRSYFRAHFPKSFFCESEANNADGYVPGKLVLEAKDSSKKWLAGFFQALAQESELSFSLIIIVTPGLIGVWKLSALEKKWRKAAARLSNQNAPNKIGEMLSREYKNEESAIKRKAVFFIDNLAELNDDNESEVFANLEEFRLNLVNAKSERILIHPKNFHTILKKFATHFENKDPLTAVKNFYHILSSWDKDSKFDVNRRFSSRATVGGELVIEIKPDKRDELKNFIESYYVGTKEDQDFDEFFSRYDAAIDAVAPTFREDHGIFFTDVNLSRFAMWYVKKELGEIGSKYIVVDPACGSGNLVSNWRSPLQMKHKVISDLQPVLLYAVEQRMKLDSWHRGKFTVVPKVEEDRGLNFINQSADSYLLEVKKYLDEQNIEISKPIAFLCNPPYSGKSANNKRDVSYKVDQSIVDAIGPSAASDSYAAFLGQMRLVTEKAKDIGLKENSLLLLFTQCGWLSQKEGSKGLRDFIFGSFEDKGAFIIKANEFFEKTGNWPIVFSIWEYKGAKANLDANRSIQVHDLTNLKTSDLATINWTSPEMSEKMCAKLFKTGTDVELGVKRTRLDSKWLGVTRKDLSRSPETDDIQIEQRKSGLPRGDERRENKTIYGHARGTGVGFCLDLTPCRYDTSEHPSNGESPWFYLDSRFQKLNTNRCFSGIPDSRGYLTDSLSSFRKASVWYATAKVLFSKGCPIWANQEELWELDSAAVSKSKFDILSMYYVLLNNSCIDVTFPYDNPVQSTSETFCKNPMSFNDKSSFWNKRIASEISGTSPSIVKKINDELSVLYKTWEKIAGFDGVHVDYKASHFISDKTLNRYAGIRQIREYQSHYNHDKLGTALAVIDILFSELETTIYQLLIDESCINYFGNRKQQKKTGTNG